MPPRCRRTTLAQAAPALTHSHWLQYNTFDSSKKEYLIVHYDYLST